MAAYIQLFLRWRQLYIGLLQIAGGTHCYDLGATKLHRVNKIHELQVQIIFNVNLFLFLVLCIHN